MRSFEPRASSAALGRQTNRWLHTQECQKALSARVRRPRTPSQLQWRTRPSRLRAQGTAVAFDLGRPSAPPSRSRNQVSQPKSDFRTAMPPGEVHTRYPRQLLWQALPPQFEHSPRACREHGQTVVGGRTTDTSGRQPLASCSAYKSGHRRWCTTGVFPLLDD